MNNNELAFKILFTENKRSKYRYETYKIDKNKVKEYGMYLDENIFNKININVEYTVKDIYTLFEKKIPEFKDLIDYLKYRDVFNNYSEWIIMLKKIFELLNINDYTTIVKKTNIGVCLDLKQDTNIQSDNSKSEESKSEESDNEQNTNELQKKLINILSEVGVIIKDKSNKFINPSFFKIFGIDSNTIIENKQTKVIKNKKDINFNEFFPGKSNGRIVRYLKIYKMIPIKNNYDKNDFKEELIDTGFVEVKKNEIYYKKECLDDLKEWISDMILN